MDESYKENRLYKWMILAISFLITLVFAISLQSLPPIFNNMLKDIHFSHSQAGLLMSAYSILGIFIPFSVAIFINKVNLKKMLILSLIFVIIGLVGLSISTSYVSLLIYRLISGAGSTVLVVLSPLLITMFFDKNNIGVAMGIFNTAVPIGTVVSANLFRHLGLLMSWRTIITGITIFTAIVLMIVIFFLSLPQRKKENNLNSSDSKLQFDLGLNLWLLAIIWMIANAQLLAYTTFAPQFFELRGMSTQEAGLVTSFIMLVSIFLTPVIGIVIDKTNHKRLFLLIGNIIMGLAFIAIAMGWLSLYTWTIILGVGFAFVPVCIFSSLSEVVKPEQTSMGLAVITAASNLGISLGPVGLGSLLDKTSGDFITAFIILSILSLVSIVVLSGMRNKKVENS